GRSGAVSCAGLLGCCRGDGRDCGREWVGKELAAASFGGVGYAYCWGCLGGGDASWRAECAAGGRVSQPRSGVCVAVPLSAAGVYGAGECGDAVACSWRAAGGGTGQSAGVARRGWACVAGGAPVRRVERRRAATGEPGASAGDEPEAFAGG